MPGSIPFLLIALSVFHIYAQTENFDIATFVPPPGWQRHDSLGSRAFFESKIHDREGGFCQIIMYPSADSAYNPKANFETAWDNLASRTTGFGPRPRRQTENTHGGWTIVTGGGVISHPLGSYNTVLACISGYGKTMSIQVNLSADKYAAVVEEFFNTLELEGGMPVASN